MHGVGLIIVAAGVVIGAGVAVVFGAFSARTDIREIDFSRSACFGQCPAYKVIFRSDGCAIFVGGSNTLLNGRYTGLAPFQKLASLVEAHHFWDLKNQYAMNVADASGMELRVVRPGMSKTVETRCSSCSEVSDDFYALGKLIDGFAFTTHWFNSDPKHQTKPGEFDVPPSKVIPGCV
jgi:uncharacterized protein DUF6438